MVCFAAIGRGIIKVLAIKKGITVLGTGVNAGFLMDAWPLFMSGVCADVKGIKANQA